MLPCLCYTSDLYQCNLRNIAKLYCSILRQTHMELQRHCTLYCYSFPEQTVLQCQSIHDLPQEHPQRDYGFYKSSSMNTLSRKFGKLLCTCCVQSEEQTTFLLSWQGYQQGNSVAVYNVVVLNITPVFSNMLNPCGIYLYMKQSCIMYCMKSCMLNSSFVLVFVKFSLIIVWLVADSWLSVFSCKDLYHQK